MSEVGSAIIWTYNSAVYDLVIYTSRLKPYKEDGAFFFLFSPKI
jgi:hypothetical protein